MAKYIISKSDSDKWSLSYISDNGSVIAFSNSFGSLTECESAVRHLKASQEAAVEYSILHPCSTTIHP
jgi:uncharacterized protein YegP (UPF0339 family)